MPCPKCAHEKRDLLSQSWTHGGKCGGQLCIDENAIVHCTRCGKSAHIRNMRMTCDSHRHIMVTVNRDEIGAAVAIGEVGVSDNNTGSLKWFKRLLEHI